jgi:16S rRNA (cytidine1402-2'-O)-methyltransferase
MYGTLYLVATPIGNLSDITLRALDTLKAVDLIACEDTRHTRKLLNHFGITTRTISYHAHNERERSSELIQRLLDGGSVAIVSDAGTPGISDPGHDIVRAAIESGIDVVALPGAVAFVTAAVVSGLPTTNLLFAGFLPAKRGERRTRLSELAGIAATLVLYEAPHRLERSLRDCLDVLGDRRASLSREMTKIHEETIRGSISDILATAGGRELKGEVVICIGPGEQPQSSRPVGELASRVAELEAAGFDRKTAMKTAAREFGLSKSAAYRELLGSSN